MGFKTLGTIFFLGLVVMGVPILAYAQTLPAAPIAEEPVKKINPEEQAVLIKATKEKVESEVNGAFNKLGTTNPNLYVGRIITGAMGVLGSLTLIMFVYSGFLWMTAAGDAGQSEKARNVLVWTSLGLVLIFSSYAILRFVLDIFSQV